MNEPTPKLVRKYIHKNKKSVLAFYDSYNWILWFRPDLDRAPWEDEGIVRSLIFTDRSDSWVFGLVGQVGRTYSTIEENIETTIKYSSVLREAMDKLG